jgi:hypothetical protein
MEFNSAFKGLSCARVLQLEAANIPSFLYFSMNLKIFARIIGQYVHFIPDYSCDIPTTRCGANR